MHSILESRNPAEIRYSKATRRIGRSLSFFVTYSRLMLPVSRRNFSFIHRCGQICTSALRRIYWRRGVNLISAIPSHLQCHAKRPKETRNQLLRMILKTRTLPLSEGGTASLRASSLSRPRPRLLHFWAHSRLLVRFLFCFSRRQRYEGLGPSGSLHTHHTGRP